MGTPRDDSFRSVGSLNKTLNVSNISAQSTRTVAVNSYATLRERAQVRRVLFEDPSFPADDKSIRIHYRNFSEPIDWKRPHELSRRPKFIGKNPGDFDVLAGSLGDSCLLPAFSCLTLTPSLIQRCIPEDQAFDDKYGGIFRFRFWRYGEWVEIVIDDRLPTYGGKLLFARNRDPDEFWAALFEKAYAKLYGSYAAVQGHSVNWSLQDITGGIADSLVFVDNPTLLKKMIDLSMARATLLCAAIQEQVPDRVRLLGNGLVTCRPYSVIGYAEIPVLEYGAILVKLRSPWGRMDWNGGWSQKSGIWNSVTDDVKEKLGFGKIPPNETWMPFSEFSKHFNSLQLCHLPPEAWMMEPKLKHRRPWKAVSAYRQWRRGFNAGGALDSPLMSYNSQFYFETKQQTCVVLSLLQRRRLFGKETNYVQAGCLMYACPQGRSARLHVDQLLHSRLMFSTGLKPERDNVRFITLPAGAYVILPVTAMAGREGKYFLRIFTDDRSAIIRELDEVDSARFIKEENEELELPPDPNDLQLDSSSIFTLRKRFLNICNRYHEIDAYGLQQILCYRRNQTKAQLCCQPEKEEVNIQRLFLTPETCKAAIAIVDRDMNGRLKYNEFLTLLQRLMLWQNLFRRYTIGNGSVMDTYSLRGALKIAGFSVSNKILEALVLRFAAKDVMNLEGFINAVVKLHVAHQRYRLSTDPSSPTSEAEKRKYLQELLRTAIYS